jgi:hypothetical protein
MHFAALPLATQRCHHWLRHRWPGAAHSRAVWRITLLEAGHILDTPTVDVTRCPAVTPNNRSRMALTPVFWSSMNAPTRLISLLAELGVETAKCYVFFFGQVPDAMNGAGWSGRLQLNSVFAQRGDLVNGGFAHAGRHRSFQPHHHWR